MIRSILILASAIGFCATAVQAHVSEQGFVLLLPTDLYIAGGVASVAITVLILMLLPPTAVDRLLRPVRAWRSAPRAAPLVTSCASAVVFAWLLWIGLTGSTDPLKNPLPLGVWTIWWIGLVALQGLFGDLWRWINPFTGPAAILRVLVPRALFRPRRGLEAWPALILFLAFMAFLLADPAPADPSRLAGIAGSYWSVTLLFTLLLGQRWLVIGEFTTVLMRAYARTGLFGRQATGSVGLSGWQILKRSPVPLSHAVFILCLLGSGSFDGLNETFWWLSVLGINPLAFPGRSEIISETIAGLMIFNAGLIIAFGLAVWMGQRLAGETAGLTGAFRTFAPTILPIALGYHIGHYLPTFLVDAQYSLAALSDPLARGDDFLGLGTFYVTTGFFNTQATVRVIWLTQAGAVVLGHVLAILLAHALAVRLYGSTRRAVLSQIPLSLFMVAYTFFGLWLLASPRGA